MATSLAAQLAQIAAKSKSGLSVKAQKSAHSKSLIWERQDAAAQSFQTIYTKCHSGFQDLCSMDSRFIQFSVTLFSEESQNEDRVEMTASENAKLDEIIGGFLHLVGGRIRLQPAILAIEWLIRRFRIHEFNTATLIATFLPYHSTPEFLTLMSILPANNIPHEYKFLDPYIRQLVVPPRAAIVQQATSRPEFLSAISSHTLESCRSRHDYPALISFWGGVMAEAVNGMVDKMRSGIRSVQADNDQTLLQRIGPTLSEAMVMKDVPGMQIASYMVAAILAAKGNLEDAALSAFMDQLVHGWSRETLRPGLVCLCILAQYRSAKQLSGRVTKGLLKVQNLAQTLRDISQDHRVDKLSNGLVLALVDRLSKKGDARGLPIVKALLLGQVLSVKQVKVVFKTLLVAAHKIDDGLDNDGRIRKEVGSVLVILSQAGGEVGDAIRASIEEVDFNIEELELKLETAIRPKLTIEQPMDDTAMENGLEIAEEQEDLEGALGRLSKQCSPVPTCFAQESSDIFNGLCSTFLSVAAAESDLAKFDAHPLLTRPPATTNPFYFTFYMRIWCGPYPTLARIVALEMVKNRLKEESAGVDFQAIIPYCIAALSDPAKKVRRAAADLLTVLSLAVPEKDEPHWGAEDLYEKSDDLIWMKQDTTHALIENCILPGLEESILYEGHVSETLKNALESSEGIEATEKHHLSRATRLSIMNFLSSHITHTPFLTVKIRLLRPINQIRSISGTTRTQLLLPVLRWWAGLEGAEAHRLTSRESVDEAGFDEACAEVVVANDKAGLEYLFEMIKMPQVVGRQSLLQCVFRRLRKMWPSMKESMQLSTAKAMLDLSQANSQASPEHISVSVEAAELLREVTLTTKILYEFLASLDDTSKAATGAPAHKRRRVSTSEHNRGINLQSSPELSATLNRATFVLELVQGAKPEEHPQLLESLFTTLSNLHHLGTLLGSELGYLLNLVLSSLLAMIPAYKDNKNLTIDASVGHGDILATCIQKSSSPSVINTALLLVASLARAAPDVVLHSVMPIFTFMGSSVLKQADDYSAHVVNQTIKEVIPPLIDTFRKSRRSLVSSTSELLSSFVIAYEHVPSHRKHDLFISLIENLGPEDFLFALLAMFVDRYGTTDNIVSFLSQIMDSFSVEVQLQTLVKLVNLVDDIFKPKPVQAPALLGKNDNGSHDPQKSALKELTLLPYLLSNRRLRKEINKLAERDDMEAGKIRDLYATLLEDILTLADTLKGKKPLYSRCGDSLAKMLDLLSISEFIKSVETLLDRPSIILRQKVLRALELRVDKESISNITSRAALLAFLPQLTAVIRESDDIDYKRTAVTCVDKIAEKYGKKDLEAVAAAAATIAGDQCLGHPVDSLRVMALLCLASLVDVLQDGIVPVLPIAIPRALGYLKSTLQDKTPDVQLHNAVYAFMTSLAQHLPYMVSGAYLDELLLCSNLSAAAELDAESTSNRMQCLQFLAKLVDAKVVFTAMEHNWDNVTKCGYLSITEYLQVLGTAIDKHPKSAVSKNVAPLSIIFLNGLDLRRSQAHTLDQISEKSLPGLEEIESAMNEVWLKIIYKLNDATFRPMFSQLVDWSVSGLSKNDVVGRTLRLESVYGFLYTFFDNLKSIVTSYASYVTEGAVKILKEADLANPDGRELWKRVLRTLNKCFEHDQDSFWQAPSHFAAVAPVLVAQFSRAASVETSDELVPAVVELAAAADSREHQKELNTALLRLLRSEDAAVRLAVVRCEQALTKRLGEEWLQTLPEMLPYISELQDDDDEVVERENRRWIVGIEETLGESLDSMLQ